FALMIVFMGWEDSQPQVKLAASKQSIHDSKTPGVEANSSRLASAVEASQTKSMQNEPQLFSNAVKEQLRHIKTAYKQNTRFPAYSQPLESSDWNLLNPNAYIPKEMPLADYPDISASIILERYTHDLKQALPVEVVVHLSANNDLNVEQVLVSANRWDDELPTFQLSPRPSKEQTSSFIGTLPASALATITPGENTLLAEIYFDNSTKVDITATFKVYNAKAELIALEDAYVEGADLVIPASFKVSEPGFYRVRANLFDAANNAPVSHINAAFHLSKDNNQGLLKVHSATLHAKQASGPYLVKNFTIIRQPSFPGDKTSYGSSLFAEHEIKGFELSEYSDNQYQNPNATQSLVFLEKLSSD
ncbi:MAG: hypothetical protein MI867_28445, partial [Pseudomonadales bacterium]|nr:hypothetical protein [Pseudomonadales bacterium]